MTPRTRPDRTTDRASIACDHCRAKKLRCDCALPRCSRCVEKNLECTISRSDLRRANRRYHGRRYSTSPSNPRRSTSSAPSEPALNAVSSSSADPGQMIDTPLEEIHTPYSSWTAPTPSAMPSEAGPSRQTFQATSSYELDDSSDLLGFYRWLNAAPEQAIAAPMQEQGADLPQQLSTTESVEPNVTTQVIVHRDKIATDLPATFPQEARGGIITHRSGTSLDERTILQLFEKNLPHPKLLQALIALFYENFANNFPFLGSEIKLHHLKEERFGSPLVIAMCSLASCVQSSSMPSEDVIMSLVCDVKTSVLNRMDDLISSPTLDLTSTLLLLTLQQLVTKDASQICTFANGAALAVRNMVLKNQNNHKDQVVINLYWSIFSLHQKLLFTSNKPYKFSEYLLVPRPGLYVRDKDGVERPFIFGLSIQLMHFVARLAPLTGSSTSDANARNQLETLQNELLGWFMQLPEPLKYLTRFNEVKEEKSCYIQMHLWFYLSLMTVYQEISKMQTSSRCRQNEANLQIYQWAASSLRDLIVLSKMSNHRHLLSDPLNSIPINTLVLRDIRWRNDALSILQSSPSASTDISAQFIHAQVNSRSEVLAEALGQIEKHWPGIRAIL